MKLENKTILITGASDGIGKAIALALAKENTNLILFGRDQGKLEEVAKECGSTTKIYAFDITDDGARNKIVTEVLDTCTVDVLINNAGLFAKTKQLTADGFEQQFGVNYLGHFLLTQKLLPVLQKAPKARIVHLASIAHWAGSIKPNKFRAEGFYNPLFYYGQSKLANLLFSNALAEQMTNSTITNNALHPGGVASDIYRDLPKPVYEVMKLGLVPTSVPAKLITQMATGDEWSNRNGEYVSAHMPDWKSPHAKNQQLARDLYAQSMDLVKKYL